MPSFVPRPAQRATPFALLIALALMLAACSSAASPAASAPAAVPGASDVSPTLPPASIVAGACEGVGTRFCGHVTISGGVQRDTDFVSGVFSPSCAEWLKGNKDDTTMLTLPIALVADVNTDTMILNYSGPGSYDVADLAGNLGSFQVAVADDRFIADSATIGTAVLNADGSGSVTAAGMQPAGDSNVVKESVDLLLTWTCNS